MLNPSEDRNELPPFAALRAFEAVGRLCGIRRAAQTLRIDHAVISRHLRALEDWCGVRLLDRARGSTVLTPQGQRYHARVAAALAEIGDAGKELLSQSTDRSLRIWCVPGFASAWLTARLQLFQVANPEIELELRPTDTSPDFTRYEADIDIRYVIGSEAISSATVCDGLRRFEIARPPVVAVTSPECLATLSWISQPQDLLRAPLLHEENPRQWQSWLSAHDVIVPDQLQGPRLWHAHLTVEASRRGQGIALANPFLLGDDLEAGRLIDVFGGRSKSIALGSYVFAARADRWQSSTTVRFRHWLKRMTAGVCPLTNEDSSAEVAFLHPAREW
ncbi:LysR substrate-binding domain-containing protein [Peristeroidobacter soli]|uniref:LysR substrate-binding domain-containing protein n=1 Tax=Peristeroidobacter soli TaxID=2497877 RepID=UPI001C37D12B|nr:LysR substrate-binding domain-containing protein [Peristeroidobacter soli]